MQDLLCAIRHGELIPGSARRTGARWDLTARRHYSAALKPAMERKVPNFAGTWEMKSSENFDELLKKLGECEGNDNGLQNRARVPVGWDAGCCSAPQWLRMKLLFVCDDTDPTCQLKLQLSQHITGQRLLCARGPAAAALSATWPGGLCDSAEPKIQFLAPSQAPHPFTPSLYLQTQ